MFYGVAKWCVHFGFFFKYIDRECLFVLQFDMITTFNIIGKCSFQAEKEKYRNE